MGTRRKSLRTLLNADGSESSSVQLTPQMKKINYQGKMDGLATTDTVDYVFKASGLAETVMPNLAKQDWNMRRFNTTRKIVKHPVMRLL